MFTMPTLNGSEKQIVWAEKIRAQIAAKLDDMIEDYEDTINDVLDNDEDRAWAEQYKAKNEPKINAIREMIETVDSAAWYIDHRSSSIESTARLFKTGSVFGRL